MYRRLLIQMIQADEPCASPGCSVTNMGHLLVNVDPHLHYLVKECDPTQPEFRELGSNKGNLPLANIPWLLKNYRDALKETYDASPFAAIKSWDDCTERERLTTMEAHLNGRTV